jgi:hypothetical protein
MTRCSRNPAAANRSRNSASVRSWPPQEDQHLEVQELGHPIPGLAPARDDLLDDQQPTLRRHCRAAGPEDAGEVWVVT